MKRLVTFFLAFISSAIALAASPTPAPKNQNDNSAAINLSANGWSYVKGTWVHPDGFAYLKGEVVRTTARKGKTLPKPPGKLALDNAQKLAAKTSSTSIDSKTAAQKKAEERQRNLAPSYAPRTGSRL